MSEMGHFQRRGFTIVELLIVIVVIGILAAITIVAYNGIQTRANNTKTTSAVRTFKGAFAGYAVDNGRYPVSAASCLGDGYADLNADGNPDCGSSNGTVTYSKNATMDAALKPYGGTATPGLNQYFTGGWMQMGLMYEHLSTYTLDSVTHPWWLSYEIGGTEKCLAGSVSFVGAPNVSSTPPVGWNGRSEAWASASKCWIPLPDPSK